MKKIKTIIIGLGRAGFQYDEKISSKNIILSHSKAIKENKQFSLEGGVDKNLKIKKAFEKKNKVKMFTDIKKCLRETFFDLGVISVPPKFQFYYFKSLAKRKIKYIICEKPISERYKDSLKLLKIAKKEKIFVMVNFIRRFNPAIIRLNEDLKSTKLGKITHGVFWYTTGLQNGGCHFIDLIIYFFGKPLSVNVINKNNIMNKKDPSPDILFKYKNFTIYLLSTNNQNFETGKFEIFSSKYLIKYEDDHPIIFYQKKISKIYKNENNLFLYKKYDYKKNINISYLYDQFLINLKKGDSNLKEAIYTLKLTKKIIKEYYAKK